MTPEQRRLPSDEVLSIQEVATMLKVPVGTLRKWRTASEGPKGFRVGKYLRYRLSAVEQFVADQELKEEYE